MSTTETASGTARDYPEHWGEPKGTRSSDERTAWVRANITSDTDRRAAGIDPATGRALSTHSAHIAAARAARLRM